MPHKRAAFGQALLLTEIGETVSFLVFGDAVRLEFLRHPWSGIVELSQNSHVLTRIDLFGTRLKRPHLLCDEANAQDSLRGGDFSTKFRISVGECDG